MLENTGGRFVDITAQAAEALVAPGLVTDALWEDLDGDGSAELVLAGEWMPVRVFEHDEEGAFTEITERVGLAKTNGWWNSLFARDLDGDGDVDLIVGNRGLNAQMRVSETEPASIDAADFDHNGTVEALISYYIQGRSYPVASRDELLGLMPGLLRTFPTYASYADATLEDILEELVGEIVDETDVDEEALTRISKTEILAPGGIDVREINYAFNVALPQLGQRSLNGFILEELGHVPEPGETVERAGVKIEILTASDTQLLTTRLTKLAPADLEESE